MPSGLRTAEVPQGKERLLPVSAAAVGSLRRLGCKLAPTAADNGRHLSDVVQ